MRVRARVRACVRVRVRVRVRVCVCVCVLRATPTAYGGSQMTDRIGGFSCWPPTPQKQECQVRAASGTNTTADGNTGSFTH